MTDDMEDCAVNGVPRAGYIYIYLSIAPALTALLLLGALELTNASIYRTPELTRKQLAIPVAVGKRVESLDGFPEGGSVWLQPPRRQLLIRRDNGGTLSRRFQLRLPTFMSSISSTLALYRSCVYDVCL